PLVHIYSVWVDAASERLFNAQHLIAENVGLRSVRDFHDKLFGVFFGFHGWFISNQHFTGLPNGNNTVSSHGYAVNVIVVGKFGTEAVNSAFMTQ
ncbi:MAG: hypothetical protein ABSH48_28005, partial [Verrucomicrobiota bacterium]